MRLVNAQLDGCRLSSLTSFHWGPISHCDMDPKDEGRDLKFDTDLLKRLNSRGTLIDFGFYEDMLDHHADTFYQLRYGPRDHVQLVIGT